jgi:DEAD/DEAH box helicase domain-containing protein
MGGLHAAEHAMIAMLPFLAMCDRQDIGGVSTDSHPDTDDKPAIFIHDAYDGGMGLSEAGYDRIEDLLEKTLELVEGCVCEDGCPSCIQSPKCGSMNQPLDKKAAILIIRELKISR